MALDKLLGYRSGRKLQQFFPLRSDFPIRNTFDEPTLGGVRGYSANLGLAPEPESEKKEEKEEKEEKEKEEEGSPVPEPEMKEEEEKEEGSPVPEPDSETGRKLHQSPRLPAQGRKLQQLVFESLVSSTSPGDTTDTPNLPAIIREFEGRKLQQAQAQPAEPSEEKETKCWKGVPATLASVGAIAIVGAGFVAFGPKLWRWPCCAACCCCVRSSESQAPAAPTEEHLMTSNQKMLQQLHSDPA